MGKRLIQQARGKGGPTYRAPSHRYKGRVSHKTISMKESTGTITDLIHCPGHSAPLARIEYDDGEFCLAIAPEGFKVGDFVSANTAEIANGNIVPLKEIPEGTAIFNIETNPGDGGKLVRSSGTFARVVAHMGNNVIIQLPSKKQKTLNGLCRACIGIVSGGHRPDKPFLKAGNKYYKMKARNKLWPKVSGGAMNAVDHPFGNARSSRKSKAKPVPRNAPPGRKVGMLRPKRTGRKKR